MATVQQKLYSASILIAACAVLSRTYTLGEGAKAGSAPSLTDSGVTPDTDPATRQAPEGSSPSSPANP